jgi:hypothetical protein
MPRPETPPPTGGTDDSKTKTTETKKSGKAKKK